MKQYIARKLSSEIDKFRQIFPVVAILGPRQCGKSTLIKQILQKVENTIFLDLQNYEDLNRLNDPRLFFNSNKEKVICLDEIQLVPELFNTLRSVIDENRVNGKFIVLGSASRDLVQKSTETLAGRIGYLQLTPFLYSELPPIELMQFWLRGGFPDGLLADNDEFSIIWRENFIKTYVERDLSQLGFNIPALQLRRFLTMCAHNHGQLLNLTKLAGSMSLTHPTIGRYINLFEQTFVVRCLEPYFVNTKKRLVKTPKIYIRDTGLLHQLLGIKTSDQLFGNPIFGASWEGLVIENILSEIDVPAYFYRTATGDEIDLVLDFYGKLVVVECKSSSSPKLTKGFWNILETLKPYKSFVVAPINEESYALNDRVIVCDLKNIVQELKLIN
jgi:predicted AAA+ superfamily ATPase